MNQRILHDETLPSIPRIEKDDVNSVYYCLIHNGCLQIADTYLRDGIRKCRIHGCEVKDVTKAPLGIAFRQIVHPYPRE